jgi:hypothetical protein
VGRIQPRLDEGAEDLVNISDKPQENWAANLPDGVNFSQHQQLNDCRELTFLRKAQADFVEAYKEFYQSGTGAAEAYHLYIDLLGRRWPLPSFTVIINKNLDVSKFVNANMMITE